MLVFANGCSMTMGAELVSPETDAWPAILAERMNAPLRNVALGGAGNDRIVRTTMTFVAEYLGSGGATNDLFVLIGWTSPDRREVAFSQEEGTADPDQFWISLQMHFPPQDAPEDLVALRRVIRRSFWSDRESLTRYLTSVISLQSFLAAEGVRHLFTQALPIAQPHPELTMLRKRVRRDRFAGFDDPSGDFLTFVRAGGFPSGPDGHPLRAGHRAWAERLAKHVELRWRR
ncbi:MAG: hypothetical protein GC152_15055 [Alphaproteobacteria bacterium]|nr:hypothetical protein [Alphaproteobacteria bacterium]